MRSRIPYPAHPLLLLGAVAAITAAVTTSATVVHLDAALGRLTRVAASGLSTDTGFALSAMAGTDLVLPVTAGAVAFLCLLRHWRGAAALALAVLATQGVVDLIKSSVERPRPAANGAIAEASGFSFPSAHSATAVALYATLTLVAASACRGAARIAVTAAGVGLVAAIGLSRVLLAAHYPLDVLAGWLTGAALVTTAWLATRRLVARPA